MADQQEFNDGHIVEGLDRCNTLLILIEELLRDHPAVIKSGSMGYLQSAEDGIMECYQNIGRL